MTVTASPSFADRPFGAPEDIVLPLPPLISVNRSRKINWRTKPAITRWKNRANGLYLQVKQTLKNRRIEGRYEAVLIIDENQTKNDLDNGIKQAIDMARTYNLVVDDSPKYLRRLTVMFGDAPEGCKLILRAMEE